MRHRKLKDLTKRQLMDMLTQERKDRHMDEMKGRTYLRYSHKTIVSLLDILNHDPDKSAEMEPPERAELESQILDEVDTAVGFLVSLENHLAKNNTEAN